MSRLKLMRRRRRLLRCGGEDGGGEEDADAARGPPRDALDPALMGEASNCEMVSNPYAR